MDKNIYAAIAMALYEYSGNGGTKSEQLVNDIKKLLDDYDESNNKDKDLHKLTAGIRLMLDEQECIHDVEPGIITIKRRHTLWNAKPLCFTKKP